MLPKRFSILPKDILLDQLLPHTGECADAWGGGGGREIEEKLVVS